MTNEYRSLKDHVYDYLVNLIDTGTISDDHKVSEQRVCEALAVSRTPVREALIQLAADGFLDNVPRKGFYVKHVSEKSAVEIVEIIGPLDGRAALLASRTITEESVSQLEFLHAAMELAIRKRLFKKYDDLQLDFHNCYIVECGNSRLIEALRRFNRSFMKREYASVEDPEIAPLLQKANDEHAQIIKLFKQRDAAELQRYIRDVHWSDENAKFLVW